MPDGAFVGFVCERIEAVAEPFYPPAPEAGCCGPPIHIAHCTLLI
jgi:hypothetical protein